jgi:hypothetical protein
MTEIGLDVTTGQATVVSDPVVQRATDPMAVNVVTPADFAAQFPTPLDPTEILDMCEEISLYQNIPEKRTGLKTELWREMTTLGFVSGSNYIAFADGECPEEYAHDGENKTVDLKNIGAKKSLMISDIMHSIASTGAIQSLLGPYPGSSGLPGGSDANTFTREQIANLKVKEIRLGMTLVLNAWDRLLAVGNDTFRPLEFDGIENIVTRTCAHNNTGTHSASGSFDADEFNQWLTESCAKPTHLFGHPQAIQELMTEYYQNGYTFSVVQGETSRVVPGVNFAGFVNTAVGRLTVVSDTNFTRTDLGNGDFLSNIYALRMTHNGEPLVYRATQIPLSLIDLTPGCTSLSFELWAKTALIVRNCCAQGVYQSIFEGRSVTTCLQLG